MQHYEFGWKNPSGKQIYAQGWMPTGKPKGVILLQHGLGEHSGRYLHVAQFFTSKGFAFLANDHSGHGKSKGKRGHVAKFEHLFDNIVQLHSEATRKYSDLPVFLYGHSLGGSIVLNYLLEHPKNGLKGIIATSPALETAFTPPAFKVALGKIMRNIYGAYLENNGLEVNHISRDPKVVQDYINDPLVHPKISAELGISTLERGKLAIEKVGKIHIPVLLMHGSDDKITAAAGSQKFVDKAQGDITFKLWEGLYHETHNEPEKEEVFAYFLDWVQSKMR